MSVRYIIVDDEPLAHEVIAKYCDMLPHFTLQKNCYDAMEAMQFLHNNTTDLMFLDLNMPKIKGFEFLRALPDPPKVIVTSAYKEFALEGYELNVVDYLVKPFSFERFMQAVNKAISSPASAPAADRNKENDIQQFFVKGDKKYHQVNTGDIYYIEAYGNYSKLILKDETIISHEKISAFEGLLPGDQFMRVHKSFIVSLKRISHIEGNRIIIGEHRIPVGQTYKSAVSKLYS